MHKVCQGADIQVWLRYVKVHKVCQGADMRVWLQYVKVYKVSQGADIRVWLRYVKVQMATRETWAEDVMEGMKVDMKFFKKSPEVKPTNFTNIPP